ncbi:MAG: PEP-CTERM sorting domain-containing protein [Chloroherpetonaceae bacterium]|nr:PEP-CTERM sorting domain-containing protein [Chthonomonadaceae bacterium]MDW8206519.1 PEP-CTERM sorting domain-containing protein [Chloroherpetonaceae bacterium]
MRTNMTRWLALSSLMLMTLHAQVNATTVYDTTGSWNGITFIHPWGYPDTATYGQTFFAPAVDNILEDFTFYIYLDQGFQIQYKAHVFAWSGSMFGGGGGQATGLPLYSSSSLVLNGTGTFQAVTINTGGVPLVSGSPYVALFTISDPVDYANSNGSSRWGCPLTHVSNDGGGGFVFYNNGNNFALLNSSMWDNFADFGDLAWRATFRSGSGGAVPEPGSVALLLGMGACGLVAMRRRKK